MEEKEIIKWSANFKKEAKLICIIAICITLLLGAWLGFLEIRYNYYLNARDKAQTAYFNSGTELTNKKNEIETVKNNYIQSKIQNIQHNFYIYYFDYYIDDEKVTEEEYYRAYNDYTNKLKQYEEEALNSVEYKKVVQEYTQMENERKELEIKYYESIEAFDDFKYGNYFNYYELAFALIVSIFIGIGIVFLTILFYLYISKMEVTVTNTRVYGKKAFGKRVDLPVDTISAIGTSFFKGIDIGTSSGRIHFKGIKNNIEIHTEISKLLNERQNSKPLSTVDEIKKYKDLLDCGVITQEEFEKKKKELLNL